jgi:hypothetical protein
MEVRMVKFGSDNYAEVTTCTEWAEWVVGVFDPTFKKQPRFFKGWDETEPNTIRATFYPHAGYEVARRFSRGEAELEMLLIQACVGPDTFVYILPICETVT